MGNSISKKWTSFFPLFFFFFTSCLSLKQDLDFKDIDASPQEIDSYITEEESHVPNIVPNTNKEIVWVGEKGVQTDYALVYLPGYSATRQDIYPIPERVAQEMGMNLFLTRFKGNGIDGGGESYKGVTVQDHMRDAYEALRVGEILGKKVVLMGTSTGATFSIWLAHRFPERIAGLVFISPNHEPSDSLGDLMLWPLGKQLTYAFSREYLRSKSSKLNDDIKNRYIKNQYSSEIQHADAMLAMIGIVDIVRSLEPETLPFPYMVIYSEKDIVISVKVLKKFFSRYGKKTLAPKESISVTGAPGIFQHGMVGDWVHPKTTEPTVNLISSFLKENLGKPLPEKGENQDISYRRLPF